MKKNFISYRCCCFGLKFVLFASMLFGIFIYLPMARAAVGETKAKELMFQYAKERLGYEKELLRIYDYAKTKRGSWVFSLKLKNPNPTFDYDKAEAPELKAFGEKSCPESRVAKCSRRL